VLEDLQVLHDRGERHVERLGQLADRRQPAAEPLDHRAPAGIRQRVEHTIERSVSLKHLLDQRPRRPNSQAFA
jgi:hypothetical protein